VVGERADDHRRAGHLVRIVRLVVARGGHWLAPDAPSGAAWQFVSADRFGNKKGPREGPQRTVRSGMASASPGGAPGYDKNKKLGNFVAHFIVTASQRLRNT
jgi:hypothetical protein